MHGCCRGMQRSTDWLPALQESGGQPRGRHVRQPCNPDGRGGARRYTLRVPKEEGSMELTPRAPIVVAVTVLAMVGAGCSAAATPSPSAPPTSAPASTVASASPSLDPCAKTSLTLHTAGKLTIGTDNPAFGPWFGGTPPKGSSWQVSDPASGEGLESAVAYGIADKLGFSKAEVIWVAVPFNNVIKPGAKAFDFDVNQVSYSSERAQAVDLSDGYSDNNQAVVALTSNAIAKASSVADLKAYRLGAQVGTTVGSLPTVGPQEYFSAVLNKGSPLTACVNVAIGALKADGTLDALRKQWIESKGSVPVLQ